jgi:hypothetical protein
MIRFIPPPYSFYISDSSYKNNDDIMLFEFRRHISLGNDVEHKTLFPNPSCDYVILEDSNFGDEFIIINSNGVVVKTGIIDNENALIDISDLPASAYYIRIKNSIYSLIKGKN